MKKYLIIIGGGSGIRFGSSLPKQFLTIANYPIILHSANAFLKVFPDIEVIFVLPPTYFDFWKKLRTDFNFTVAHKTAEGGPERFHSVKSGLKLIAEEDSLVAIHDAVRPLISKNVIFHLFADAEKYGNAIPFVSIGESLREKMGALSRPVDRNSYVLVQTPQVFRSEIIKSAYLQAYDERFTDDASVLEKTGETIRMVEGNPENPKITRPSDLLIAEALIGSIL